MVRYWTAEMLPTDNPRKARYITVDTGTGGRLLFERKP